MPPGLPFILCIVAGAIDHVPPIWWTVRNGETIRRPARVLGPLRVLRVPRVLRSSRVLGSPGSLSFLLRVLRFLRGYSTMPSSFARERFSCSKHSRTLSAVSS